jgi:uncharacterized damage-inducible protein DinB
VTQGQLFLNYSVQKLTQLRARILTCLEKLSYDDVWNRGGENENAVGNLVLHLCGNVNQWIVSGVGGAPDTRTRDKEFAARGEVQPAELAARLTQTTNKAMDLLRTLPEERLGASIQVQGYDLSVLEGIYHVVEHFAQHTGQIVLLTKHYTGEDLGFYRHLTAHRHREKTP